MQSFAGYNDYPTNLTEYDYFRTDGEALRKRMKNLSKEVFCAEEGVCVRVLDVEGMVLFYLFLFFVFCFFWEGERGKES